jgi:hypothetical protein
VLRAATREDLYAYMAAFQSQAYAWNKPVAWSRTRNSRDWITAAVVRRLPAPAVFSTIATEPSRHDRPHGTGDGPRPVQAGYCLSLGFWPEEVQRAAAKGWVLMMLSETVRRIFRCP